MFIKKKRVMKINDKVKVKLLLFIPHKEGNKIRVYSKKERERNYRNFMSALITNEKLRPIIVNFEFYTP